MVAERARLALTSVPIEVPDPLAAAEAYGGAWALPLPAPGIVIEAPLIAAARAAGATVALDGQGGDEVLGPAYFVIADRLRHGRALAAYKLARRYPGIGPAPTRAAVRLVLTGVGVRGAVAPRLHERIRGRRPTGRYAPAWLRPGPTALFVDSEDPWRWKRLDGPRWWAALADTLTRGRERADIADYVRRRARLGGLEGRSPLLDLGLVEFVLRIPPEANFDPVTSRPLAREALRGTLPEAVLARRDKSDFAAFYHRLLAAEATLGRIRELLDPRRAGVGAYVDLVQVHRDLLDRPPPVGAPRMAGLGGPDLEHHHGGTLVAHARRLKPTFDCTIRCKSSPLLAVRGAAPRVGLPLGGTHGEGMVDIDFRHTEHPQAIHRSGDTRPGRSRRADGDRRRRTQRRPTGCPDRHRLPGRHRLLLLSDGRRPLR